MKWKKASLNYDTKQCKNHTIQRMGFKGTITLFAVKEFGRKLQMKKGPVLKAPEFSFKSGS
jgi:hypothetical protein